MLQFFISIQNNNQIEYYLFILDYKFDSLFDKSIRLNCVEIVVKICVNIFSFNFAKRKCSANQWQDYVLNVFILFKDTSTISIVICLLTLMMMAAVTIVVCLSPLHMLQYLFKVILSREKTAFNSSFFSYFSTESK